MEGESLSVILFKAEINGDDIMGTVTMNQVIMSSSLVLNKKRCKSHHANANIFPHGMEVILKVRGSIKSPG
jgi:hypothetical protein